MAVEYEELEGSPFVKINVEGHGKELRRLLCKWADRWDVAKYVMDNSSPHTGLDPWSVDVQPYSDGRNYSRITGTNPISYEKALVVVEYNTLVVNKDVNFFGVREQLEGDIHMVRIDPGTVKYSDGKPVSAGEDITYPTVMVKWIKSFKTIFPLSGMNISIVNKINVNTVFSQKFDVVFAPGTLLCKSVDIDQYSPPWASGNYVYRAEFIYNQNQWGTWVDKHGNVKRLRDKRTDQFISPFQFAYFPI